MSEKPLLDIKIDTQPLQQALQRLQNSVSNTAPLMRSLAGTLLSVTQQNFTDEGNPPWIPSLAAQKRSGQTLTDSADLYRSVQASSDSNQAMVSTNVDYASTHQLGKTLYHKPKPSKDKRKRKKGLMTKSWSQKFPARPFLPVTENGEPQPGLEQTLLAQVEDYLRRCASGDT